MREVYFGDHGPFNPKAAESEFDPKRMRMTVNLRYAVDDGWLLVRGRSTSYGYDQIREVARRLLARSEFRDPAFSWGDWWIDSVAKGDGTTGNPATWLQVAASHHFAQVIYEESIG
jgi:hypothetical protein